MTEEASPLLVKPAVPVEAGSEKELRTVTVEKEASVAQREWDGPLWKMCGDCDQPGLSTFAYVKMCTPLAWGHNVRRAFGGGFWKSTFIFVLLFCFWGYALIGHTSRMSVACGPHPPHPPHGAPIQPRQKDAAFLVNPEQQQFLAGATFNPAFAEELTTDEADAWITLEGGDEIDGKVEGKEKISIPEEEQPSMNNPDDQFTQNRDASSQVQASSDSLLHTGRKMLHKHKHHDDDDDNDDDDDKKHHGHKHKDAHKDKHADKSAGPLDKMFRGPVEDSEDPMESQECYNATATVGAVLLLTIISYITGITYAARIRTAIREKYNIKGTKLQDWLAWTFCAPCALCQESRTLAKNNVHDGVWYGETVLSCRPVTQPMDAPKPVEAPTKPV